MKGIETLVSDTVDIVRDLTKQAVNGILDKLLLKPIKAISLGVLKAIWAIPTIPFATDDRLTK